MRRSPYLILVLAVCIAFSGCSTMSGEEPIPTPVPTAVKPTFTVQRGDVIPQIVFPGHVQPVETFEMAFKSGGTVGKVYVAQDEWVTKGQLLAELSSLADLQAQLATAQAEADAARQAAQNRIRRAEINLEIAQLNLSLARAGDAAPDQIRIYELEVELAEMDLAELQAAVSLEVDTGRIAELEKAIESAQLVSTADGQVLTMVGPQQTVRANAPVITVGDTKRLEAVATAGSYQIEPLSEGMTLTLALREGAGAAMTGSVRQLPYPYGTGGPTGGDPTVRISIDQDAATGGYKLGDVIQVTITLAHKTGVLWLPPNAIRSVAGRTFVIVQTPTGQQHLNITVGVASRERVEIVEGLAEGQVVVGP